MALNIEQIIEDIKSATVVELSELIEAIEEEFGVEAAAPVAVAAAPAAGGEAGGAAEQTEFNVVLTSAGDAKIQVIKVVRDITGLGLKEAKDLVDAADSGESVIKEAVEKDEADEIVAKLQEAGASAEAK